jgi:hypothetical protein
MLRQHSLACMDLAQHMYGDRPYAREVGRVGQATGVATGAAAGAGVAGAEARGGFGPGATGVATSAAGVATSVAGVAASAGDLQALHDIPPDVLTGVLHWLQKGCATRTIRGQYDPFEQLDSFRRQALDGAKYCWNGGCEVEGLLKDFKVESQMFHIDPVIFQIDTVIFHTDTVIFHIDTIILSYSSISIPSSFVSIPSSSISKLSS